ncbi:MAG: SBBP repeat-containing protein [Bryobacteraceae bacterium]
MNHRVLFPLSRFQKQNWAVGGAAIALASALFAAITLTEPPSHSGAHSRSGAPTPITTHPTGVSAALASPSPQYVPAALSDAPEIPHRRAGAKLAALAAKSPDLASHFRENLRQMPMSFEANLGQTASSVRYLSRGFGYNLFLTSSGAMLRLRSAEPDQAPESLKFNLLGAVAVPAIAGRDPQAAKSHYYKGDNPSRWIRNVPHYGRVEYQGVYPGINLVFYGNQSQLEYDFVINPGADPAQIHLQFDGQRRVYVDKSGDLILATSRGELRQKKPAVYQEDHGSRKWIAGRYVMRGEREVGFQVDGYDATAPLIIDPVLVYSSYFGGTGADFANDIAADSYGNFFITGGTDSIDLPLSGSESANSGGRDAFVAEFDRSNNLVFSSYLGGAGMDWGMGVAVDGNSNIYVAGVTDSTDFPTLNPIQAANGGGRDAFVAQFSSGDGVFLNYSSYLGGSGDDYAYGVAADFNFNMYVTGQTGSPNFPVVNALQPTLAGANDAFVTKIQFSRIVYSTYLGGSGGDAGERIAVDGQQNVYVTGATASINFPTVNPLQAAKAGGTDAFLTKVNSAGDGLFFSTYLGGAGTDWATDVAVDNSGSAYVTGYTLSTDFPTRNPIQAANAGSSDVFITHVDPSGTLVYSTYFGGSSSDYGYAIAVDYYGYVYVAGGTDSLDLQFPGAFQAASNLGRDGFIAKIDSSGNQVTGGSYLGGAGLDEVYGVATNLYGDAFLAGTTTSTDFPLAQPSYEVNSGSYDAFLSTVSTCISNISPATQNFTVDGGAGSITVTSDLTCNLYPTTDAFWITITPLTPPFQTVQTINFTVSPNSFGPQTGHIFIGAQSVTITQDGLALRAGATNPALRSVRQGSQRGASVARGGPAPTSKRTAQQVIRPKAAAAPGVVAAPAALNFTWLAGSTPPPDQSLAISSGTTSLSFRAGSIVQTPPGGAWLQVASRSIAPATLPVHVDVTGLVPGIYNGNISIITPGDTSAPVVVPVTLTVTCAPPVLVSMQPNSGVTGTSVPVTLLGTNFVVGGMAVAVRNPGIAVGNVAVASSTELTAVFTISANAAPGPTDVTVVSTCGGSSGPVPFTVNPPPPVVTTITPSSGPPGATVSVSLTGSNFFNGAVVKVSNPAVTVVNSGVVNANFMTATLSLSPNAVPGPVGLTVTTLGGTSSPVTFTINPATPVLTSIKPPAGAAGKTVPVTLMGTNFTSGATVSVSNPGVTVGTVTLVNSSQITASFAIAADAATGPATVTVTTVGGTTGPVTFTVIPPPPSISAINPAGGSQGAGVPVTLTGANFVPGTTISTSNPGITIAAVTVVSPTQITATFNIAANAPTGAARVTVTTSGGTSQPASFTVNPPAATLTSINPASGLAGTAVPVTLSGTNFASGATIAVGNPGVAVSNVTIVSANQITATFTIAADAAPGAASVTVTTSGTSSAAVTFTINSPAPSLTSIDVSTVPQGATLAVTLSGSGFLPGATVSVNNPGVTVSGVTVVSASQITATFAVGANAAQGAANVTVTTTGGTSGPVSLTVAPGIVLSINGLPGTITPGQQPPITLTIPDPSPIDINGQLTLKFTPNQTLPIDPTIQFSIGTCDAATGICTVDFNIPAGQKTATFTQGTTSQPQLVLQTGTVAGTLLFTAENLTTGGETITLASNQPLQVSAPPQPPGITSVTIQTTTSGFSIVIQGFSNTREITEADFHFTPKAGTQLQTADFAPPVTSAFQTWYGSTTSVPFGSVFVYTQPFTFTSGGISTLQSVTVTLKNAQGSSASASANF